MDKVREALEEWRPVIGYELKYLISNLGRVKTTTGTILTQWLNSAGYPLVKLSNPRKDWRIHILVAVAFIPNPNNKPYVNHIDNDRVNAMRTNLEWCTQAENIAHADKQGRMQRGYWIGKRSPNASLSNEDVLSIRTLYATGDYSFSKLGQTFNISKRAVGRIINRETYTDV